VIDPIMVAGAMALAAATGTRTSTSTSLERLTIERALAIAVGRNAEVRSMQAEVAGAVGWLAGDSRWVRENPSISAAIGPRVRMGDGETEIDVEIALEQPIEVFGQRGLRAGAAEQALRALEHRLAARKNELVFEVRSAFARALAAKMRVALAVDGDAVAQDTLRAAEERQRSGAASRIEVNSARVELGRAARDRFEAELALAGAEAELASLLALERLPVVDGDLAAAAARDVAQNEGARAELEAAISERRAAELEEKSAARDAFPELGVGARYAREEGADIVLGTLSIELPVFERNQGERALAESRGRQAAITAEETEQRVAREVELARRRYASAKKATGAYAGEVVRAMEENSSLAAEAYRSGKFDFLQLTLVRRETLDARRGYIESLEALNLAEAELLRAIGGAR
jgi:outer membrane protein, heavy metal efflux system